MTRNYKEIVNQIFKAYNDSTAKAPEHMRIIHTRLLLQGLNGLYHAAFSCKDAEATVEMMKLIADVEEGVIIQPYNL
ncbi:hypothetical protein MKI77_005440, partial [Escherichia coli]|nr:hypothetical protein [Escherichia coli]